MLDFTPYSWEFITYLQADKDGLLAECDLEDPRIGLDVSRRPTNMLKRVEFFFFSKFVFPITPSGPGCSPLVMTPLLDSTAEAGQGRFNAV
jgi:hypothetical protein